MFLSKSILLLLTSLTLVSNASAGNPCDASCVAKKIQSENPTIGTRMAGGFVAGTRASGCPATLIGQLTNLGTGAWATGAAATTDVTGAEDASDGRVNQAAVLAVGATGGAVLQCSESSVNGYTDWYLPSIGEMECIMSHKFLNNNVNKNTSEIYWTSNNADLSSARFKNLNDDIGDYATADKDATVTYQIWCIRRP